MKNTTHRVVILKNVNSDIISQAILILKGTGEVCEDSVLREAERVVAKYMKGGAKRRGGYAAAVCIATVLIGVAGFFVLKYR